MPVDLLCVTKAAKAKEILTRQLKEIFENNIVIEGRCLDELKDDDTIPASLTLFSNRAVFDEFRATKDFSIGNALVAERYMYLDNLNEILSLKPGQRVLVVSNYRASAEDTIREILGAGIDRLQLIPYYPGCSADLSGIDTAISPAAGDIVPEGIERVIDIGVRRIAISTIFYIVKFFDLALEIVDKYISEYSREFMLQAGELNRTITAEDKLNHEIDAILNSVHDAIVAVDTECRITVFNPKAEQLFGCKRQDVVGKNVSSVIRNNDFKRMIDQKKSVTDVLEKIDDRYFISNKTPLFIDGAATGVVAMYQDVTEVQKLEQEVRGRLYEKGYVAKFTFDDIISESNTMEGVVKKAIKFTASEEPVLLGGETGVGKEMFAQAIHNRSDRKKHPFVAVNFGALPETLAESELFGYEEGAFTGAKRGGKPGLFEQAHNGTIFLDEIGDATLSIQIKILRTLEEKCVIRLGGTSIIPVNVRIIAATNKNLKELINQGKFREDLYYRLNVLSLRIPPLRKRKEDIVPLSEYFLSRYGNDIVLSDDVKTLFRNYPWKGNVRELENVLRYLSAMYSDKQIETEDLPQDLKSGRKEEEAESRPAYPFMMDAAHSAEYKHILQVIRDYCDSGRACGRGTIGREVRERYGSELTDEKVRWRLKSLAKTGYIEIGRTKQGCRITERGREAIGD